MRKVEVNEPQSIDLMVMSRCSLAGRTEGNRHSTNQCVVPIKVLKLLPESGCVDGAVSHADVHQKIGGCR